MTQLDMYQSVVDALYYLIITRFEITFLVYKLYQFVQSPRSSHWDACKRLSRYVNGTIDYGLHLKVPDAHNLVFYGFMIVVRLVFLMIVDHVMDIMFFSNLIWSVGVPKRTLLLLNQTWSMRIEPWQISL